MQPPSVPEQPAPTARCASAQHSPPHSGQAMPQAADGLAATHGTWPSRPTGGVPFPIALHTRGTSCLEPWHGETTGAPGRASLYAIPTVAPLLIGAEGQAFF